MSAQHASSFISFLISQLFTSILPMLTLRRQTILTSQKKAACLVNNNIVSIQFLKYFQKQDVPSAESSRSVRGLGKDVSGKPYPRLCNTRRPRLEPGTFRSQAVRLYRLHQARPSEVIIILEEKQNIRAMLRTCFVCLLCNNHLPFLSEKKTCFM